MRRRPRAQAALLERDDLFEDGLRIVHHGGLGDPLGVVHEVRLGADACRAVPRVRSTAPLPRVRSVRRPQWRREWGGTPPVASTIINGTTVRRAA